MNAFFNDKSRKDEVLASLKERDVRKEGIDYFKYEAEHGIPNEVGWWEDVLLSVLHPEDIERSAYVFLEAVPVGADLTTLPARFMLWQFEDPTYGLKNFKSVRNDKDLMAFCDELTTLYRREISGTPITAGELQELFGRIETAWSVVGERQRVASMQLARRFAWAGGRKWAWVPTKGWSGAWKWLLAATRVRNRSGAAAMLSAWNSAWKWQRFWESDVQRARRAMIVFREYAK